MFDVCVLTAALPRSFGLCSRRLVTLRLLDEMGIEMPDRDARLHQSVQSVITDQAGIAVFDFVITHLIMEAGVSARVVRLGAFMGGGGLGREDQEAAPTPVRVDWVHFRNLHQASGSLVEPCSWMQARCR
jgi:hypothetical protein